LGSPFGHGADPDVVGLGEGVGSGVGEESSQPLTVDEGKVWSVIGRGARPRVIKIVATTMINTSASTPISSPIAGTRDLGAGAMDGGGRRGSLVVAADQAVPSQ
jgi:hypothetical protein